jgi:hypothetical protein
MTAARLEELGVDWSRKYSLHEQHAVQKYVHIDRSILISLECHGERYQGRMQMQRISLKSHGPSGQLTPALCCFS